MVMAAAKSRTSSVPTEWLGFAERLSFAVRQRMREEGRTQNDFAQEAEVDSGNFSKMLTGEKANVLGATVVKLARALRVLPAWLLTGQEPSGLGPDVQTFDAPLAGPAGNDLVEAPSKGELKGTLNVVVRTLPKRD